MALLDIKAGDYVVIRTVHGQYRGGRAQGLLLFPEHVVLNGGGKHGTPIVANLDNIYTVRRKGGIRPVYINNALGPGRPEPTPQDDARKAAALLAPIFPELYR